MGDYYKHEHLTGFAGVGAASPELARRFFDFYGAVFEEGALTQREKALIALAVAHTVQCPYCIEAYTNESLSKGADLEQMTEAVFVATAIRGGASLVHGMQMIETVKKKGM
jgi:4-carboxymuconolactone decarboxylase